MSRVLVVANETVEAEELLAELRRIEDEHSSTLLRRRTGGRGRAPRSATPGLRPAPSTRRRTGSTARSRVLRGEGLECDGEVGDMVPFAAVRDALDRFEADLIVISTHPARARAGCARTSSSTSARRSTCRSCTSSRTCTSSS